MDCPAPGPSTPSELIQPYVPTETLASFPEIVQSMVREGLIAATASLIGTVFLGVVLDRMMSIGGGETSMTQEVSQDLSTALTIPWHITLSDNSSITPTSLFAMTVNWPVGLLTLIIVGACGMAGWRAARATLVGPIVAIGVAAIYATLVTVMVFVAGSYANIFAALGNTLGGAQHVTPMISIDPADTWQHAFLWCAVSGVIGAGLGRMVFNYLASFWNPRVVRRCWAGLVGALWATGSALLLCGVATLIALRIWKNGTPQIAPYSSVVDSLYYLTAPLWAIHALVLGVGGSLHATAYIGDLGNTTSPPLSLLDSWPMSNWVYVLPLIVFTCFLFGCRRARDYDPTPAAGFFLVLPFALVNVTFAWAADTSFHLRVSQDFMNQISQQFTQQLGGYGFDTAKGTEALTTGAGVGISYGPSLMGVFGGSVVLALIGAGLVYLWYGGEPRLSSQAPAQEAEPAAESPAVDEPAQETGQED